MKRRQPNAIAPAVMRVWPDAGQKLGLSKSSTYEAVRRGEIRVIRFGRRIVVPLAWMEELLAGRAA